MTDFCLKCIDSEIIFVKDEFICNKCGSNIYSKKCPNCLCTEFCIDQNEFEVCTGCGLEFIGSNIINEVNKIEFFKNYNQEKKILYIRKKYLEKYLKTLQVEIRVRYKSEIHSMMHLIFKNGFFSIKDFNSLVRNLDYKSSSKHIWYYIFLYNGFKIEICKKMEYDILFLYTLIEKDFNKRNLKDFKNKKKFFTLNFLIYSILKKLNSTFKLEYDVNDLLFFIKKPSKYMIKANQKYFDTLWNDLNLDFLGYNKK